MEHLLDDAQSIKATDRSGMLNTQMAMPEACLEAVRLTKAFLEREEAKNLLTRQPSSLIVAGMGGSAIGGEILQDWLVDSSPVPIYVSRTYSLPAFVDQKSLVFAISYSGDTDETLSSFIDGQRRGCRTISITSGGRLRQLSLQNEVPCLTVPSGMVPRAALAYLFVPLAIMCGDAIGKGDLEEELKALVAVLKDIRRDIAPDVSAEKNPAKQLALSLVHTIPLVYAQAGYWSVGLRMKTLLNENSKVPSYAATLPEAFHNEVMGYECQRELLGSFSVILLRDVNEDPRVKAKIEVAKRILEPRVRVLREIWATGGSRLAKIFFMLYLCDVTSTYLALLYGVDPSSTETISKIKKASPAGLSVGGTKVIER